MRIDDAVSIMLPDWPPLLATIYSELGAGRGDCIEDLDDQSIDLAIEPSDEDLMRTSHQPNMAGALGLTLSVDGQLVDASVDGASLLRYCESWLSAPDLASLPKALQAGAVAWALEPWLRWCRRTVGIEVMLVAAHDPGQCRRHACERSLRMRLTRKDRTVPDGIDSQVVFTLSTAMAGWLIRMIGALSPKPPRARTVQLTACAGFARLDFQALQTLNVGDVILCAQAVPVQEHCVMLHFGSLWILAVAHGPSTVKIEEIAMEQKETETEQTPAGGETQSRIAELPIVAIFEIGRACLSLAELADLQKGRIIELDIEKHLEVGIRVQGRLIGSGRLVQFGERVGVHVVALRGQD